MSERVGSQAATLWRFALRRLAQAVPLLLVVSLVVFGLIHLVPGGPMALYLENPNVRPEDIARLRASLGLDRPLAVQYVSWLGAFVQGDWGYSFSDGRPVIERIAERLPATIELGLTSTALALLVAIPVGLLAARRPRVDQLASATAIAAISLPTFWSGLILQLVFANLLGWLPSSGRVSFGATGAADRLTHLVLPCVVLATVHAAAWSRYLRGSVREVLAAPFVRAARARGVRERAVLFRHVLRAAVGPMITVVLLDVSIMASGAVVTESIFAWPGVGSLFTEAMVKRDYTVLMAFLMCAATSVVVFGAAGDIALRIVDPRVREDA